MSTGYCHTCNNVVRLLVEHVAAPMAVSALTSALGAAVGAGLQGARRIGWPRLCSVSSLEPLSARPRGRPSLPRSASSVATVGART